MSPQHLGFVGVGRMGAPMAGRLLAAGHRLTIHDVDEAAMRPLLARGAVRAASPAAVASAAEIVLASLPMPDVVKAVALSQAGIIEGSAVRTFVDLSTTGPRVAAVVADALAKKNIVAVDAPVSGGPAGAANGTLAVMVAAPRPLAAQLRPVLEIFGKVFLVGEAPGMGQTMKLVNNLLSATALAATSEAMVMGAKAGLDAAIMIDVLNAGSGRNSATQDKFPRCVLPRRFDFGFTIGLLHKDVRLCLEEAEALGVPMPVGNAVRQLLAVGKAGQGAGADITALVRTIEEWAGAEVRAAPDEASGELRRSA